MPVAADCQECYPFRVAYEQKSVTASTTIHTMLYLLAFIGWAMVGPDKVA